MSEYDPTPDEVSNSSTWGDALKGAWQDTDTYGNPGIHFETEGCGCCSSRIVLTSEYEQEVEQILIDWERHLQLELERVQTLLNTLNWHGFQAMLNEL